MRQLLNKKYLFILGLLLVIFVSRFIGLGSLPKGLHADEASFLLNTYSLAQTGRDEDNRRFPLWFNSYIDSKPALYSYLQLPFVAGLGPTTAASRLPAVLLGAASIGLVYWVLALVIKKNHALLTVVLLTVSPWHVVVSRSTQEVMLAFVLGLIAIGSFLTLIKQSKLKLLGLWLTLFLISAMLGMYTYHAYKIFLPALILGWSVMEVFWPKKSAKTSPRFRTLLIANGLLIGATALLTFAVPQSLERFKAIGILQSEGPLLIAEEQIRRATGVTPLLLLRIFYNKVVGYSLSVVGFYTQHFSFDFLFLSGGEPKRYLVPFQGLFYLIEALLLPIGIFISLNKPRYRQWAAKMLWWLVIAPIPAALTSQEVPSVIRSFPLIIPMLVFIATALIWLWEKRKFMVGKIVLAIVGLGYLWGLAYFGQQFVVQQEHYQPWHRNTADEKLAEKLVGVKKDYDLIDIATSRDLYVYLALEDSTLIKELQQSFPQRKAETFTLDKYFFNPRECDFMIYPASQKVLQVFDAGCELPLGYAVIDTIGYDDGAQVYELIEYDEEIIKPAAEGEGFEPSMP